MRIHRKRATSSSKSDSSEHADGGWVVRDDKERERKTTQWERVAGSLLALGHPGLWAEVKP